MNQRLTSSRFPYIPFQLRVRETNQQVEALLDTGFDGDVVVPENFAFGLGAPDEYARFRLADGRRRLTDVYFARVELERLGAFPARLVALGDEYPIGRSLSDRFAITFDHGRQIIVEP